LSEVTACGERINPETSLFPFIHIALVDILEIDANVFVNNEMLVVAAPFLIAANILGGAKLDVIIPGRGGNCNGLSSASVYARRRAVSRRSFMSRLDGCD